MSEIKTRTIFNTPIVTPIFRAIASACWRLAGWKITGRIESVDKAVFICVPHTSNWDLGIVLAVILKARLNVAWMGKDSLFPRPIAGLVRWLGGISIDRSKSSNTVDQMKAVFEAREKLFLVIAPEGTRSQVNDWKKGFYHIAEGAGVPIQLAALHGPDKEVTFGPLFYPTGDVDADLPKIQAFFEGKVGIRVKNTS